MTTVEATSDISAESTPKLESAPKLTLLPLTALVAGSMIGGSVSPLRQCGPATH
jgi:hypothetical protein